MNDAGQKGHGLVRPLVQRLPAEFHQPVQMRQDHGFPQAFAA
jgi:hypothetical protein